MSISYKVIANSGQCFRWVEQDDSYKVPVNNDIFEFNNDNLLTPKEDLYLDNNCDYNLMKTEIVEYNPELKYLYESVNGMRILNQPFFETCISFIISQNNNIPKIKNSIRKICGGEMNPFPDAEALIKLLEKDSFSLGYRINYIKLFCERYLNGDLDELKKISSI